MAKLKCIAFNFAADVVSACHLVLVFVVAFGWFIPGTFIMYVHGLFMFITWWSWVFSGSCVMAKWEYQLRAVCNPGIEKQSNGYLHYHMRHLTGWAPPLRFIRFWGLVYLSVGMLLWIIDFFDILA